MQGQKGAQVQVDIDMLSTADKKKWTRPPINVFFEVRNDTIQMRVDCMITIALTAHTDTICLLRPVRQVPQDRRD